MTIPNRIRVRLNTADLRQAHFYLTTLLTPRGREFSIGNTPPCLESRQLAPSSHTADFAKKLFEVPGVIGVFLTDYEAQVYKSPGFDWTEVGPFVLDILASKFDGDIEYCGEKIDPRVTKPFNGLDPNALAVQAARPPYQEQGDPSYHDGLPDDPEKPGFR